jgi:hypothetical protein
MKQTAAGEWPSPVDELGVLRLSSGGPIMTPTQESSTELSGGGGVSDTVLGGLDSSGTISTQLAYNTQFQEWMASIIGQDWGDSPSADGDILSTPALASALTRDFYGIEQRFHDQNGVSIDYHRWLDTTISSLQLTIPISGAVEANYGIVGGQPTFATSSMGGTDIPPSPTRTLAPVMTQLGSTITWGGALASGLNGICTQNLTFTIDRQNRSIPCIGSLGPGDVVLGRMTVKGSCTILYEGRLPLQDFVDQEVGDLMVEFVDTTPIPNRHTYLISFYTVKLTNASTPIPGTGTDVISNIEFECIEGSAGPQVEIVRETVTT